VTGRLSDMQAALFDDRRSAPQRYVDLYLLDLEVQTVRRLTDHPHVDFGSRARLAGSSSCGCN
jgi:hypothetical protein